MHTHTQTHPLTEVVPALAGRGCGGEGHGGDEVPSITHECGLSPPSLCPALLGQVGAQCGAQGSNALRLQQLQLQGGWRGGSGVKEGRSKGERVGLRREIKGGGGGVKGIEGVMVLQCMGG